MTRLLYPALVAAAATTRRTAEHTADAAEVLERVAAWLAPYPFHTDPEGPQ